MILLPRFMLLLNHPDTITWNLAIFYLRSMFVVVLLMLPFVWMWINSHKKIFTCVRRYDNKLQIESIYFSDSILGLSIMRSIYKNIYENTLQITFKDSCIAKKSRCTLHNHLYRHRVSVETLTKWNHATLWGRTSSFL